MRSSRTRRTLAGVLVTCGVLLAAGCLPDGMPGYMDNGKSVVAAVDGKLWVYDVKLETVKAYTLPGLAGQGKMLGDQFWAHTEGQCERLDWGKMASMPGPKELEGAGAIDWVAKAVEGSWAGKKCIFVPEKEPTKVGEKYAYAVLPIPDFKKLKTAEFDDEVVSAGGGWWTVGFAELFDDKGKSVLKIPEASAQRVIVDGPRYARLSTDNELLLLASISQGGRTRFGVLEVQTGKYLWGGDCSKPMRGNPLIKRDEAWALTHSKESHGIDLVRYRKPEKGDAAVFMPQTVLTYPLGDPGGEVENAYEYNLSPDGKEFVLVVEGKRPRLVFIPIKEGVKEKDIRTVELKEEK